VVDGLGGGVLRLFGFAVVIAVSNEEGAIVTKEAR